MVFLILFRLFYVMKKAVFLDRDGTINEEMGYINHVSRFRVFDFVPQAIKILNDAGFKVIVVTNQSGVARGYFDENLVREIHKKLLSDLKKSGARIDGIYYCPHHPEEGRGEYKKDCACRKPNTGMIDLAVQEHQIDLSGSFMVGDRYKDILFAKKAGLRAIFVKTGYGIGEYTNQRNKWKVQPLYLAENLLDAAQFIRDTTSAPVFSD